MKHPPLTDAERARMTHDHSDEAVAREAAQMIAANGVETAAERAIEYRDKSHLPGSPRAAYWSRVVVQILAPLVVSVEPSETSSQREADDVPKPHKGRGKRMAPDADGARADGSTETDWFEGRGLKTEPLPAPRWKDENDNNRKSKPKEEDGPEQGSLF